MAYETDHKRYDYYGCIENGYGNFQFLFGESIEDACAVHGADADELVAKINEYLASK